MISVLLNLWVTSHTGSFKNSGEEGSNSKGPWIYKDSKSSTWWTRSVSGSIHLCWIGYAHCSLGSEPRLSAQHCTGQTTPTAERELPSLLWSGLRLQHAVNHSASPVLTIIRSYRDIWLYYRNRRFLLSFYHHLTTCQHQSNRMSTDCIALECSVLKIAIWDADLSFIKITELNFCLGLGQFLAISEMGLNTLLLFCTTYLDRGDVSALIIIKSKCQSTQKSTEGALPPGASNI